MLNISLEITIIGGNTITFFEGGLIVDKQQLQTYWNYLVDKSWRRECKLMVKFISKIVNVHWIITVTFLVLSKYDIKGNNKEMFVESC